MNEIVFVFGSNLAGRHGKGAAYYAMKHFGAVYGEGVGRTGNAYAIPTKDEKLNTLSWGHVEVYVKAFLKYAEQHPDTMFILTAIGTGLAGFPVMDAVDWLGINRLPENIYVNAKLYNAATGAE